MIGLSILKDETSKTFTKNIKECIEKYTLKDKIKIVICDTTAVNTGCKNGIVTNLRKFIPTIIYHPCRLHVLDRVLRVYLDSVFITSKKSPNIDYQFITDLTLYFDTFVTNYKPNSQKKLVYPNSSRNDYSELSLLCEAYKLRQKGERPIIIFKKSGPLSNARWNSRAIYLI